MSKYKDMAKSKWQEKPGGSIRGQVSGLTNRAKPRLGSHSDDAPAHVARPLSTLRDPSSFAPPPRRTGSGLAPAPPPSDLGKRKVVTAPSKFQDPRAPQPDPRQQQIEYHQQAYDEEPEPAPRGPYRANTTGLATDHLPPPPGRRDGADGRSPAPAPPSYETATRQPPALPASSSGPPKPSLPPRLPARTSASATPAPSPGSNPSQGAAQRLGAAGVSVPALGIGQPETPSSSSGRSSPGPPLPGRPPAAPTGSLQDRFSRLSTSGSSSGQTRDAPPAQGTSWAEKQAALKTASSLRSNPSSVSASDARSALGTANNFRQRHGDQVAAGAHRAAALDQKYGIANKVGGYVGGGGGGQHQQQQQQQQKQEGGDRGDAAMAAAAAKKKPPPPPPPKKKPGLGAAAAAASASASASAASAPPPDDGAPPPVPMATRPTF